MAMPRKVLVGVTVPLSTTLETFVLDRLPTREGKCGTRGSSASNALPTAFLEEGELQGRTLQHGQ